MDKYYEAINKDKWWNFLDNWTAVSIGGVVLLGLIVVSLLL